MLHKRFSIWKENVKETYLSMARKRILLSNSIDGIGRQPGRVVNASDSQYGGPGFESRSGHLLDLFSVVPSSNPRSRL